MNLTIPGRNGSSFSETKKHLDSASTSTLIEWATQPDTKAIVSTSFGPYSAVLLKLVCDIAPKVPVIWVDTGLNTPETYRFVDRLCAHLNLNLFVYHPVGSQAQGNAEQKLDTHSAEQIRHSVADELKLEPFRRALREHAPDFWINGIRQADNAYRKTLGKMSHGPNNIVKIAPLFEWTERDLLDYISAHSLPNEKHYFDPTKAGPSAECGLHCRL